MPHISCSQSASYQYWLLAYQMEHQVPRTDMRILHHFAGSEYAEGPRCLHFRRIFRRFLAAHRQHDAPHQGTPAATASPSRPHSRADARRLSATISPQLPRASDTALRAMRLPARDYTPPGADGASALMPELMPSGDASGMRFAAPLCLAISPRRRCYWRAGRRISILEFL